jgi:hypothetical protein
MIVTVRAVEQPMISARFRRGVWVGVGGGTFDC